MKTNEVREGRFRCKAFSGEGVRNNLLRSYGGELRVWDDVAGCFTTCHALSPMAADRLLAKLYRHGRLVRVGG